MNFWVFHFQVLSTEPLFQPKNNEELKLVDDICIKDEPEFITVDNDFVEKLSDEFAEGVQHDVIKMEDIINDSVVLNKKSLRVHCKEETVDNEGNWPLSKVALIMIVDNFVWITA